MEKKFKLKYPTQQNFISVEGFDKSIPIEDLIEEEFLQYAEECKQEFIKHYYSKCKIRPKNFS